jgi:hypothetical protein
MDMADSYRYDQDGKGDQRSSGPNGQGYNYYYKYSYGSGSGRGSAPSGAGKPPRKDDGWGEWIGIGFILLFLPSWLKVLGVLLLVRKLASMDAKQKNRYKREAENAANRARQAAEGFFHQAADEAKQGGESRQHAGSAQQQNTYQYGQPQQEQAQPKAGRAERKAQPDGWNVRDPAENRRQKAQRQAKKDSDDGKGLIIGGGVMSAIFALGTAAVSTEYFQTVFRGFGLFNEELIGVLSCMMFLAGGLAMLFSGIGMSRRSERYMNYLAYIGANREVPLAHMAATFDVSVNKLCKDLRRMLSKGILPTGYLDLAEGKLYLTEMGYHAPEPKREPSPEETAQEAAAREDDILREIRQVNDEIPDAVMSEKINRIEEITGKILKYQKSHPNKEGQLRTFLNYYLPTTLKVLRAYAQLDAQGIEGENISAAKKRIEDMMDQVVYGFEKQLDKLFQDDAMDITSDVEVLENMLKKDGLSDEGGITMTL